jgi:hypothetical protein
LIQRLQDTSIHGGNHIHRRVQFFLSHSCLPCIRKAPFDSRVAEPHHRHGKTHEHLLAFGETLDGMGVTIESAKISLLQRITPFEFDPGLRFRIGENPPEIPPNLPLQKGGEIRRITRYLFLASFLFPL